MGVWEFVVVYLLVFALLQFAVYRYLRRDDGRTRALGTVANAEPGAVEDRPTERGRSTRHGSDLPVEGEAATDRRCHHCGAPNEPDSAFSYCRNCVKPLGR